MYFWNDRCCLKLKPSRIWCVLRWSYVLHYSHMCVVLQYRYSVNVMLFLVSKKKRTQHGNCHLLEKQVVLCFGSSLSEGIISFNLSTQYCMTRIFGVRCVTWENFLVGFFEANATVSISRSVAVFFRRYIPFDLVRVITVWDLVDHHP